jgi:hypothetical protein
MLNTYININTFTQTDIIFGLSNNSHITVYRKYILINKQIITIYRKKLRWDKTAEAKLDDRFYYRNGAEKGYIWYVPFKKTLYIHIYIYTYIHSYTH